MFRNFENPDPFYDGFSFGFGRNSVIPQNFTAQYRAFPVSTMLGSSHYQANYGGKIFLPSSALDKLSRLNVEYPMMFSIANPISGKTTNAGVLEFTAEEGHVYLPDWVTHFNPCIYFYLHLFIAEFNRSFFFFQNTIFSKLMKCLELNARDFVTVQNVSLLLGTFVKIQPQSTDFLDISDHRAVLENALRNFSALTTGDVFTISYNDKLYDIKVLETQPSAGGVSIVETDLQVDFEAPPGYVEPSYTTPVNSNRGSGTPIQGSGPGSGLGSASGSASGLKPGSVLGSAPLSNIHHSASMAPDINRLQKEALLRQMKSSGNSAVGSGSGSVPGFGSQGGARLSGAKDSKKSYAVDVNTDTSEVTDFPNSEPVELDLPIGQLYFGFPATKPKEVGDEKPNTFSGSGQALRTRKKRK